MKKYIALFLIGSLLLIPTLALAQEVNPDLEAGCGLDIVMVLDESGSISSTEAQQVRDAAFAVIDSMMGTGSRLAIVEFSTTARTVLSTYATIDPANKTNIFTPYLNGPGYNYQEYAGGLGGDGNGYTNWQDALIHTKAILDADPSSKPAMVLFMTDGVPTENNGLCGGDLPCAIIAADNVKKSVASGGSNAHMFVYGIGIGSGSTAESNIIAISGPDKFGTGAGEEPDILKADYTLGSFSDMAAALREAFFALCEYSLTITKYIDDIVQGDWYVAGSGWQFSGEVLITQSSQTPNDYEWTSPVSGLASVVGTTQTATTDGTGVALYQWAPHTVADPQDWTSTIEVNETGHPAPGYYLQGASCEIDTLHLDGSITTTYHNFIPSQFPFTLTLDTNQLATCSVYNSHHPWAVTLAGFQASPQVQDVLVGWMTSVEGSVDVFNLYRGSQDDFAQASQIANYSPHGAMAPYTYLDQNVQAGETYHYWLQIEFADGSSELFGPVQVVFQGIQIEGQPDQLPEQYNDWREWVLEWLKSRK